jgi:hypothetical protein
MEILSNVLTLGTGLYRAQTLQAEFLRGNKAYDPGIDPRLPKHDTLAGNLTIWANAEIKVSNISLYSAPDAENGIYGVVRIREEVIRYADRFVANSTLTTLTRNVANTLNCTISGNLTSGNLVSVLGLQTVTD